MTGFVAHIRCRARAAARAAAFTVAGVVFCLTGLGFLTVALWILIAGYQSALVANAVIGALYLVLGFCFMALGGQPENQTAAPPQSQPKEPLVQLAEGFAAGMQAGRAARSPRD